MHHPEFDRILEMTMDNVRGQLVVTTRDGDVVSASEPSLMDGRYDPIARSTYRPVDNTMEIELRSGSTHTFEIDDGRPPTDQLEGRQVVYLDQNKWIDLARSIHSPRRLGTAERAACRKFLQLASDDAIICPLSSGHVAETGGLAGPWREQVSTLIAELSRGWIFRCVLAVRHDEIADSLARLAGGLEHEFPAVVTPDTRELFGGWPFHRMPSLDMNADFDALVAGLSDMVGATAAAFAVLRDGEAVENPEAEVVGRGWAATLGRQANQLNGIPPEDKRRATLTWFVRDLRVDVAAAVRAVGLSRPYLAEWLGNDLELRVQAMPYLGRLRDITDFRLRNLQDEWCSNDLVDINYLALGAAYADVVIGERKTIALLERAGKTRPRGAQLFKSFRDYVRSHSAV